MTVLLVDPEPAVLSGLADALAGEGHALVRILDPGLVTGVSAPLSLAVCPYLPDASDPLQVLRSIHEQRPALPVVVVSESLPSSTDLVAAMRLGAVDVLQLDAGMSDVARQVEANVARLAGNVNGERPVSLDKLATDAQLRELQRDQRAGRYIQMGMLPPSPMAIDGYRLRHKIFPSLMLSGDFVDYFRLTDRHLAFYMADVSGHGASSAFVTVLLKNFSRRLRREYRPLMLEDPAEILLWLNRELIDNQIDKHVAMFLGVIDLNRNVAQCANAGHYPSAMLVDTKGARILEIGGKPIGLFEKLSYASQEVTLEVNSGLYLVSDGILEVLQAESLVDKEKILLDAVSRAHQSGEELWQVLNLEQQPAMPDDMACLTLNRTQ